MEALIEQFLFRYRYCPLPGCGLLSIVTYSAIADWGHKTIQAPQQKIEWQPGSHQPIQPFLQFIAQQHLVSMEEAERRLNDFCRNLSNANPIRISSVGQLVADESGTLQLEAVSYPASWMPMVQFERVVHPDSVHTIRVGDNERSSSFMSSYFAGLNNIRTSHWRVAALVVFLLSAIACIYYYFVAGACSGNLWPVQPGTEPATYQLIQP